MRFRPLPCDENCLSSWNPLQNVLNGDANNADEGGDEQGECGEVGDAVQLNRAIEHRDLNAGWGFEERGRVKRLLGWRRNVADPVVQLRSGHRQLIYLALDGNRSARNDRMWHWRNAREILIAERTERAATGVGIARHRRQAVGVLGHQGSPFERHSLPAESSLQMHCSVAGDRRRCGSGVPPFASLGSRR